MIELTYTLRFTVRADANKLDKPMMTAGEFAGVMRVVLPRGWFSSGGPYGLYILDISVEESAKGGDE